MCFTKANPIRNLPINKIQGFFLVIIAFLILTVPVTFILYASSCNLLQEITLREYLLKNKLSSEWFETNNVLYYRQTFYTNKLKFGLLYLFSNCTLKWSLKVLFLRSPHVKTELLMFHCIFDYGAIKTNLYHWRERLEKINLRTLRPQVYHGMAFFFTDSVLVLSITEKQQIYYKKK